MAGPVVSPKFAAAWLALSLALGCSRGDQRAERIEFWAIGSEGEVVAPLVREFERLHPGTEVRIQQIPWTAAHEKLLTAFAGDALPDVCQLGNTWIAEFAALGALEDLSDRVGADRPVDPQAFFPGVWEGNVVGDDAAGERLYGVPWYVDTRVLFYRTDLLAAAGFAEPPQSWDEWLAMARAVQTRQGADDHAMLLPTNEWEQPVILGLQAGSTMLRDGGRYGGFEQPEFARAFEFYASIFAEGLAPKTPNTRIANVWQEFERGAFVFYVTGPWNVAEFRKRLGPAMNGKWTTAPLPGPDDQFPGASMAGGCSLVLFAASPRKDAAWRLVEYLACPEQQAAFFAASGNLPTRRAAWQDPRLAQDEHLAAFRRQLDNVVALPRVPEWEQIAMRVWPAAEAAINGRATTAAALARLDRQVDSILEKRRWMLARHSPRIAEAD
ncbi:MAG: sugar ABC transporter substrate-binding protein [Pirellulales bacterium]|nr:sugar ABC transporter substrate-binding protein [Pirellulales bacterium]